MNSCPLVFVVGCMSFVMIHCCDSCLISYALAMLRLICAHTVIGSFGSLIVRAFLSLLILNFESLSHPVLSNSFLHISILFYALDLRSCMYYPYIFMRVVQIP